MAETQTNTTKPKENIMGTAPIGSLLLKLAVPMMISMLVQALYNVVDSIFVSHVAEQALSAVSLAFPIQSLMIAFAVGTAVGVNALLSKSLGEKNFEQVNRTAENGLFLAVCSAVPFILFGLFLTKAFFGAQTQDPDIYAHGVQYLSIVAGGSLFMFVQCMQEKLLVSTGKTTLSMVTQLTGALLNIILDPIFIFGYLGMPAMGAGGAALATVLGQMGGCIMGTVLNLKCNKEIQISYKGFKPHGPTIRRIYQVGLPSIAMQSIGSVMTFCMNHILIGFTSTAVAVFGVYFKLQSFVFMPVFGLNSGMVPIVSYNYGARRPDRIMQAVKMAVIYAEVIMVLGFLAAQFLPETLLGIFAASGDMMSLGCVALRIISIHFLVAGFDIIASSTFQALGRGTQALWVSVARQLVVLIPVAYLLSLSGNVNMVWWAFPTAEVMSFALCILFLRKVKREVIAPMEQPAPAEVTE